MTPQEGAAVLLLMTATIDGQYHEEEASCIQRWAASLESPGVNIGMIYNSMQGLTNPEYMQLFMDALTAVRLTPAAGRRELISTLFDVVMQDGKVDRGEQSLYRLLQELLG